MEITDILKPDCVLANFKASSKKQALQELAQRAADITGAQERAIFDVLLERERLGTTGVGNGIAIPHGKLAQLENLQGMFARLEVPVDFESIDEFGQDCFVPLTVGGGIIRIEQVQKLLRACADKVCVNTAAYTNPELVSEIAKRHGTQCVVASIDVRQNLTGEGWLCFSHAGKRATGREITSWASEIEDRGAGEILITSIERDGTFQGYDLVLIEAVVNAVKIPVIAAGGAGNYQHMVDAVKQAGASAVAAASMFHFTEQTPAGAKAAMQTAGIPVRRNFIDSVKK